ncbi:MAG: DUF4252 domain-containing protein [Planctomycetota bacterium]
MIRIALVAALTLLPALHSTALAASVDSHPGVAAIGWGDYVGGREPTVSVRISPTLLRFMTSVATEAAAELEELEGVQEIIGQVRQVYVEVYEGADEADLSAAAETETSKLISAGWESVVRAREDDERVDVMILPQGEMIVGIVIVAAEEDELSFVNVAGDFDPELIGTHLGAIARQAKEGEVDLEELLGEAVLADLIDDEEEEHHDD